MLLTPCPARGRFSSMRTRSIPFLLIAAVACGGSSTPTAPVTVPDANIAGDWNLTFTNMQGGGINCHTTAIPATITQTASTFTGAGSAAWTLTCVSGTDTQSSAEDSVKITNGTVHGNTITFSLATSATTQSGTLNGDTITGTASWTLDIGNGVVTIAGQFSMTR